MCKKIKFKLKKYLDFSRGARAKSQPTPRIKLFIIVAIKNGPDILKFRLNSNLVCSKLVTVTLKPLKLDRFTNNVMHKGLI